MRKLTKTEVDYSPGHKDSRCGICRYYEGGACKLVAGTIEAGMWCDRFKKEVK